eukprot:2872250-Amphidinium_carterae.1
MAGLFFANQLSDDFQRRPGQLAVAAPVGRTAVLVRSRTTNLTTKQSGCPLLLRSCLKAFVSSPTTRSPLGCRGWTANRDTLLRGRRPGLSGQGRGDALAAVVPRF